MLTLKNISKVYGKGETEIYALKSVGLTVNEGEFVAIMGPSGSGKSTLMNILGCLDRPTSGEYWLVGNEVSKLKDDQLAYVRNQYLGFIFQSYNLLPGLTALKNVELPLIYRGMDRNTRERLAIEALAKVGLEKRLHHRPSELSGGQQQRVAIARAIAGKPAFLLADEPTGNLDSRSELEVLSIFQELNEQGITIMIVTHDEIVGDHAKRIVRVKDGEIVKDEIVPPERRLTAKDSIAQLAPLQNEEAVS